MAKIYCRAYKRRIDAGEITIAQAIELAGTEVPARWRSAVQQMLAESGLL